MAKALSAVLLKLIEIVAIFLPLSLKDFAQP
jgi:hypothetical protein